MVVVLQLTRQDVENIIDLWLRIGFHGEWAVWEALEDAMLLDNPDFRTVDFRNPARQREFCKKLKEVQG